MRAKIVCFLFMLMMTAACSDNPAAPEPEPSPIASYETDQRRSKISINYSPYTNGLSPEKNSPIPLTLVEGHLELLDPYASALRLFGVTGELEKIYQPAKEKYGFRIIAGCWIDKYMQESSIYKELDALIKLANDGWIDVAVVGSETLYRGDFPVEKLIEYIQYARERIDDKAIPVTTSDTAQAWNNPELVAVCDVILVTIYPFFSEIPVENAAGAMADTYEDVKVKANGKQVIISETGWPTAGSPEGAAIPSMENARRYFEDVYIWSLAEDVEVIFFSAFDEGWKNEGRKGDIGIHWGHFTADGRLKEAYLTIH